MSVLIYESDDAIQQAAHVNVHGESAAITHTAITRIETLRTNVGARHALLKLVRIEDRQPINAQELGALQQQGDQVFMKMRAGTKRV